MKVNPIELLSDGVMTGDKDGILGSELLRALGDTCSVVKVTIGAVGVGEI